MLLQLPLPNPGGVFCVRRCRLLKPHQMIKALHFRNTALVLPLVALLMAGCSKEEQQDVIIPQTSFSMDYPAIPFSIDSSDAASPMGVSMELDPSILAQALQAQSYSIGQLKELKFTKARLYFTSPLNSFYNSVQSVTIQIGVDQSLPVTVADLNPVPNGAQTLLLQMPDVNVLDLIQSNNVRIIAKMQFDGPIPPVTGHSLVLSAQATVTL